MTPEDRDYMLELCRRIYREKDPGNLAILIKELNEILRRKIDELLEVRK